MKNYTVKFITKNAIIAAVYFLLSVVSFPISFGLFQVRIAEFLVLLCFFNSDYILGITIGCFLTNLLSPLGFYDAVFGSIATLVSCALVSLMKHLLLGSLIPVVLNGLVVGAELYFLDGQGQHYFVLVGIVALGELIAVTLIGYAVFILLKKNKHFFELIDANKNIDFKW